MKRLIMLLYKYILFSLCEPKKNITIIYFALQRLTLMQPDEFMVHGETHHLYVAQKLLPGVHFPSKYYANERANERLNEQTRANTRKSL